MCMVKEKKIGKNGKKMEKPGGEEYTKRIAQGLGTSQPVWNGFLCGFVVRERNVIPHRFYFDFNYLSLHRPVLYDCRVRI